MARQGADVATEDDDRQGPEDINGKKRVTHTDGTVLGEYDEVLLAVGRELINGVP